MIAWPDSWYAVLRFLPGDHHRLALAPMKIFPCLLEILHVHQALVLARGEQRRLVHQIGQIGADMPGVPRAMISA